MCSTTANPTVATFCLEAQAARARSRVAAITVGQGLVIASLLLSPLAFGAVEPWAWGTLAIVAALVLFLWATANASRQRLRVVWSPLYVPVGLFFLLAAFQALGQFTLDVYGTRVSLLKLATDTIIFFATVQFWGRASGRAWHKLGLTVAVLAFSLSLFAIVQFFSCPNLVYWSVKPRWGGWIFGPYVNHNHYAGLMEMLIPVATGFLLSLQPGTPGRALLGFLVLVPVASVLLSGSRGGFTALLVESLVLLTILLWSGAATGRWFLTTGVALGITTSVLLFFWMDPGAVASHLATVVERQRPAQVEAGFEVRSTLSKDALHTLRDHPWFGTGLGTFEVVYPQYRSFPSDKVWDHAHDDYAEALAETGLLGGALIAGAVTLFVRHAFRDLADRLADSAGWIQLGAAIGCCGLLVHSLFDFNLHIPANAAWFAACAAWATCGLPPRTVSLAEQST